MNITFIFSLPRSGSTLLQRIIAAHPEVATVSEPWLLLPLFYMQSGEGVYTEYNHRGYLQATRDLSGNLPGGSKDIDAATRSYAMRIYQKAAPEESSFFLDKTPRYHLIANRIMQVFHEEKFIFLWRNPLSVVASLLNMDDSRSWNLPHYEIDLFKGLRSLVSSRRSATSFHEVWYEDLVVDPEKEARRIFEYLDLRFDQEVIAHFDEVQLEGRLGDPTGTEEYDQVSTDPLEKWKSTLNNPVRKRFAKRYLDWIGQDDLALMGYEYDTLRAEIDEVPTMMSHTLSDLWGVVRGTLRPWVEPIIMREKMKHYRAGKELYVHS